MGRRPPKELEINPQFANRSTKARFQTKKEEEPMRTILRTLLICLLVPAAAALAQDNSPAPAAPSPDSPLTEHNKDLYRGVTMIVLRWPRSCPRRVTATGPRRRSEGSARSSGTSPTRSTSSVLRCSARRTRLPKVEQTRSSKADLIAALDVAIAYCDSAYDGMTDVSGAETVKLMGDDSPKLVGLTVNAIHSIEHYGNLIIYLPGSTTSFHRRATRSSCRS